MQYFFPAWGKQEKFFVFHVAAHPIPPLSHDMKAKGRTMSMTRPTKTKINEDEVSNTSKDSAEAFDSQPNEVLWVV